MARRRKKKNNNGLVLLIIVATLFILNNASNGDSVKITATYYDANGNVIGSSNNNGLFSTQSLYSAGVTGLSSSTGGVTLDFEAENTGNIPLTFSVTSVSIDSIGTNILTDNPSVMINPGDSYTYTTPVIDVSNVIGEDEIKIDVLFEDLDSEVQAPETYYWQFDRVVPLDYCYQEHATGPNSCGAEEGSYQTSSSLYTNGAASSLYDGDYSSTFSSNQGGGYVQLLTNYVKPTDAVTGEWHVKHGILTFNNIQDHNVTIPSGCFNQVPIQLKMRGYDEGGKSITEASCYDGSLWISLSKAENSGSYGKYLHEESISWGFLETNDCYQETATESTECGGLDTGTYLDVPDAPGGFDDFNLMIDGDFDTFSTLNTGKSGSSYIDYEIPLGAVSVTWKNKFNARRNGGGSRIQGYCWDGSWNLIYDVRNNLDIDQSYDVPQSCLSSTTLKFKLYYVADQAVQTFFEESVTWDIPPPADCYQESADISDQTGIDGSCSLNYGGQYILEPNYMNVHYNKPASAIEAAWRVKHGSLDAYEIDIPSECFDQNNLQLRIYSKAAFNHGKSQPACYDGAQYIDIGVEALGSTSVNYLNVVKEQNLYDGNWDTPACYANWINKWADGGRSYNIEGDIWEEAIIWKVIE